MASDFILVAGSEWQEVASASSLVGQFGMTADYMQELINSNDYLPVNQWAEDVGLLPAGQQVIQGKMFDLGSTTPGEVNVRLFLIFGPAA